jgi:uncharacterized membrane protein YbhN (UPF0104 family)
MGKAPRMGSAPDQDHHRSRVAAILAWKPPTWATALLAIILVIGAWWLIYQEFHQHSLTEIWSSVLALRKSVILIAAGWVLLSFLSLILDEYLSLYLMGAAKPFFRMLAPAYATYSLSNALSFSFATGPAVRTRMYRNMLGQLQIGTLSAVTGASVFVGAATTTAYGFLFGADEISQIAHLPPLIWQAIGAVLLIPAAVWIFQSFGKRHALSMFGITITTPGTVRAAAQLIVAVSGWLAAAGVLYELLPAHGAWSFSAFSAAFVIACYVGAASGAPAGLGVFDAAILSISMAQNASQTAAALIVYRIIYTLAPLALGVLVLGEDLLLSRLRARREQHKP